MSNKLVQFSLTPLLILESPYLWHKRGKKGVRPVAEKLGITPGSLSLGVTRALVDFGAEEYEWTSK